MLNMGPKLAWKPPIVALTAARQQGVDDLVAAVEKHRAHLAASGEGDKRAEQRLKDEAADVVSEWARAEARRLLESDADLVRRLNENRVPYAAADEILKRLGE